MDKIQHTVYGSSSYTHLATGESACETCDRKLCDCGNSFYEKLKIIDELMETVESDNSKLGSATCTNPKTSACNTCLNMTCHENLHIHAEIDELTKEFPFKSCQSACDTCQCLWESGHYLELDNEFPTKTVYDIAIRDRNTDNSTIVDKIQGGFLYVCALFALTVNKVVDYIADAFRAAYKDGRL